MFSALLTWEMTSDRRMSGGLTKQQLEKFEKDGILIIQDFLTKDEVTSIRIVCNHGLDLYINQSPGTASNPFNV